MTGLLVFGVFVLPGILAVAVSIASRRRSGYAEYLDRLRRPVGAGLLFLDDRLLLVHLEKGPWKGYWFLPAAYFHPPLDKTTQDTAERKIRDAGVEVKVIVGTPLTGSGQPLENLDTTSYARECGLLPTEVHIYECRVVEPPDMIDRNSVRWCRLEEIPDLPGRVHPVIPQILTQFFRKPGIAKAIAREKLVVFDEEEWARMLNQTSEGGSGS